MPLRVAFLADPGAGRLAPLARHGIEAAVVPDAAAARASHDVTVATTWRDAHALAGTAGGPAAFLVGLMEDRLLPPGSPEVEAAQRAYRLPLVPIASARWIAEQLAALEPERPVLLARAGVDKERFTVPGAPAPRGSAPLRVLVEGVPDAPSQGVREALTAVAGMREPRHVTFVGTPPAQAGVDAVRDVAERPAAYAAADVVVRVPRVDAAPLALVEAFHGGATAVTTPVTGHDEHVVDGLNALLTSWDDDRGTARLLDLLARDGALLERLRAGALATARAWPSLDEAAAELGAALAAVAAAARP